MKILIKNSKKFLDYTVIFEKCLGFSFFLFVAFANICLHFLECFAKRNQIQKITENNELKFLESPIKFGVAPKFLQNSEKLEII